MSIFFAAVNSGEPPAQKQRRIFSADAQWCIENKAQLTLKAFVDRFGYLEKQKAVTRYRTIISKYIRESEAELLDDLKSWRQTASWDQFWMEKQRELAKPNTQKSCLDYATSVLKTETASITGQHMSCATSERENVDSITCGVPNGAIDARDTTDTADTHSFPEMQQPPQRSYEDDSYSSTVITPWIVAGVDLTRATAAYRKAAHQLSKVSPLNIGHSLQDILSFAGVLLLCPSQHSEVMMVHLDKVDEITQALLSGTLNKDLDWNDHEYLVLLRVIKNLAKKH